jgi:hypothetical protein
MGKIPKWIVKSFSGVVFAAFFFIAGMLFESLDVWFQKPVEVTITNQSGTVINSMTLTYTGYTQSGQINIQPPANDKAVVVKYFQSGEGTFKIQADLANGKVVRGEGGYVEPGYSFKKAVTTSKIIEIDCKVC